jgi:Ca2+-binding RTX toxin-like protein
VFQAVHATLATSPGTAVGYGPGFRTDVGSDKLYGIENIHGGGRADVLVGSNGPNALDGGGGSDQLSGLDGADVLEGGPGLHDAIDGGAGVDTCTDPDGATFTNCP